MSLIVREGLWRLRGLAWPVDTGDVDALGEVLCAVSYDSNKSRCVLARPESAVAMLVIQGQGNQFAARLAAETEQALDEAERMLRDALPRAAPDPERQDAVFAFWRVDAQQAGAATYRRFEVPSWDQIAANYSCQTALCGWGA